eukprot:CAMPEP_0197471020 /NCGR_PEP_ID=MMETSP1309-20131121/1855_1 /TAXON_ID=464262 /ORGANISM="Genus nov. species nov., Strain RCC998" /LENGTH=43 /DNA_ID= /DNA_START= /DNA_END= /DNA_ORIENTATION=
MDNDSHERNSAPPSDLLELHTYKSLYSMDIHVHVRISAPPSDL